MVGHVGRPTFSTFRAWKHGQANEFLWKSYKSLKWWNKLAWPTFSTLRAWKSWHKSHEFLWKSYKSLKWWNKLAWPTFSTLPAWKSWPSLLFPLVPRISVEVLSIMKMVEQVGLANIFHISGLDNVARPTFSSIFVMYRTSAEIHGKSGKSWPSHDFPSPKCGKC